MAALSRLLAGPVRGEHGGVVPERVGLTQIAGWTLIALGALVWMVGSPPGFLLTDDPVPFFAGLFLAGLSLPLLTRGRLRIFFSIVAAVIVAVVAIGAWGFAIQPS
jgi:hypothetical protein